jgi:hypothetical protein
LTDRDPRKNFEQLWKSFHDRYPFFRLRKVDWKRQYELYRPKVTRDTGDAELFDIFCGMLAPLNDGHVELRARIRGERKERYFNPERKPRFWQEFTETGIKQLFKTTDRTLLANGFGRPTRRQAWMLRYTRSRTCGYVRILELEDVKKRKLIAALDDIAGDFPQLDGFIIDIRNCPGGDDSTAITIINRFCDRRRVAFHRRTKVGPGEKDFSPLKTWYLEPEGEEQFTRPVALLTCDSVFSGGEAFALAIRQLPHVTIIGEHTNGIFSYQLEKRLPNGWRYCLSYQEYLSADRVCYEGRGVPVDIKLLNRRSDIEKGVDPLIVRALKVLEAKGRRGAISRT